MKNLIIFTIFLFTVSKIYGQEKSRFSIEVNAGSYSYSQSLGLAQNKSNFGYSLYLSGSNEKFKFTTGIGYSVRSFYSGFLWLPFKNKDEYHFEYLKIPLIAHFKISSKKKFSFSLFSGFTFNQIIAYKAKIYNRSEKKTYIVSGKSENGNGGRTFLLGTTFSVAVKDNWLLNLSPVIGDEKTQDFVVYAPGKETVYFPRFFIGLQLGVEYIIKQKMNDFRLSTPSPKKFK